MFLDTAKRATSIYKRHWGNIAHPSNNYHTSDQCSFMKTNSKYLDNMVEYISCLKRVSRYTTYFIF